MASSPVVSGTSLPLPRDPWSSRTGTHPGSDLALVLLLKATASHGTPSPSSTPSRLSLASTQHIPKTVDSPNIPTHQSQLHIRLRNLSTPSGTLPAYCVGAGSYMYYAGPVGTLETSQLGCSCFELRTEDQTSHAVRSPEVHFKTLITLSIQRS